MTDVMLSPEDLATQLERAAADVAVEQELPLAASAAPTEAVAAITDQIYTGTLTEFPVTTAIPPAEQVAFLTEVKDRLRQLWEDFRVWRSGAFSTAEDKLREIGSKAIETAKKLGVTVEHLLGRMQRRVTQSLIEGSVLAPFSVTGAQSKTITLAPSEVTSKTVLKSAPSLVSLDVTGVVKLLSGLLSMELEVDVKYGVAQL